MRATPDDILGMAFFARVVEARSFSDAARALGVSKSAVSARVARLEEKLGVRLLHRTTRRLALTADGVRLYERCARVVAEADEAAEVAAGASEVPRGTVRIHAPPALAEAHLAGALADFMRAHPAVSVDLRLSDRHPDLTVEQIDVAIVIAGRLTDSGLTTRKLAAVRVAVCAAPRYLRRRGIPFRPQDLVLHDCVSHSIRQGNDDFSFHTDEGAVSMASFSKLIVDDVRFLREAANRGLGIVMLPELLVADDLAAGRLVRVLDDFQTIELAVHALHPHGRLPPASVRALLDHVAASFRNPRRETRALASPVIARKTAGPSIPMTEQDVRRLTSVAALYDDLDPDACARLRERIARVKTMPAAKIPETAITMSSRIQLTDDRRGERELSLVYPWDESRHGVSVLSALGLALLGSSVGAQVADGPRTLTVEAIPYQPEAAGDHHL